MFVSGLMSMHFALHVCGWRVWTQWAWDLHRVQGMQAFLIIHADLPNCLRAYIEHSPGMDNLLL